MSNLNSRGSKGIFLNKMWTDGKGEQSVKYTRTLEFNCFSVLPFFARKFHKESLSVWLHLYFYEPW